MAIITMVMIGTAGNVLEMPWRINSMVVVATCTKVIIKEEEAGAVVEVEARHSISTTIKAVAEEGMAEDVSRAEAEEVEASIITFGAEVAGADVVAFEQNRLWRPAKLVQTKA